MSEYEFLLKVWGAIENDHLAKKLGVKNYYWFSTAAERETMRATIQSLADKRRKTVMFYEAEGALVRKRTVAKVVFRKDGKFYEIDYDFGYGYSADSAEFMFTDGNYGCDCNRSIYIHRKYPDFPEIDCGGEIEMIKFEVVYEDYPEPVEGIAAEALKAHTLVKSTPDGRLEAVNKAGDQ